jgi:hypothetical protein
MMGGVEAELEKVLDMKRVLCIYKRISINAEPLWKAIFQQTSLNHNCISTGS